MGALSILGGARRWAACSALILGLLVPPAAAAAVGDVYEGDIGCAAQPGNGDVRLCGGATTTWDGTTKIDVNVILPPEPGSGADGPYPAIGVFHGWGGSKIGIDARTQAWAEDGYVVFSMSDRGWGESCGAMDPDRLGPSCADGYNHLMDTRYEVRDAQYLLSILADEDIAIPRRIGATGMSYGGGMSMALAALRNRTMMPDGTLVPWRSPEGAQMELAAAVPQWPWTDLAYSLMPNGLTLDYVADAPYLGPDGDGRIGVEKLSFVSGLYATGLALSNYAPPLADPDADLTTWYGLIDAGEPYDENPLVPPIVEEIAAHHSSYYIDHSQPPAPLLIQSGWNDDLFPVDEALRFYNRTRTQYPGNPISLLLSDHGHARSQNKEADVELFEQRQEAWFDHYLKGASPAPESRVEALTTTCGSPSEGPYAAPSWRELAPGEIRLDSPATQTVTGSGDPAIGTTFDPIAGADACATASEADQAGVATYRLPAAPEGGFTLLGSPTIVADVAGSSKESELAARLLDVSPADGEETLVARGVLRPGAGDSAGLVFQLHPQAYRFASGHEAKLELLAGDAPYLRASNAQAPAIEISDLELRLPVLESPGSLGGLVEAPAPKPLPPGYEPAIDYLAEGGSSSGGGEDRDDEGKGGAGGAATGIVAVPGPVRRAGAIALSRGRTRAFRRGLLARVHCTGTAGCAGLLVVKGRGKHARHVLGRIRYSVAPRRTRRIRVPLTRAGRQAVAAQRRRGGGRRAGTLRVRLLFRDAGRRLPLSLLRPAHLPGSSPSR
jgi:predicted acyl esterase